MDRSRPANEPWADNLSIAAGAEPTVSEAEPSFPAAGPDRNYDLGPVRLHYSSFEPDGEVFATAVDVHIERMDSGFWWLMLTPPDGRVLAANFTSETPISVAWWTDARTERIAQKDQAQTKPARKISRTTKVAPPKTAQGGNES